VKGDVIGSVLTIVAIAIVVISIITSISVIEYASSQKDGRGSLGDIKNMLLSTEKVKRSGGEIITLACNLFPSP
jgi:hypothetical protein